MNLNFLSLRLSRKWAALAYVSLSSTALLGLGTPASAQTCTPLDVVGAQGTEVTKTVSLPGLLFIDSNWDTDFSVSGAYSYFVVNFLSDSGTSYDIDVFLKYPDDSVDSAYSTRNRSVVEGEPIAIQAESRISSSPYQVNLRVGGLNAEGNTYTASVVGCR